MSCQIELSFPFSDYDSMRKISIKKLENLGIHVILRKNFLHLQKQETDGQIGPIV